MLRKAISVTCSIRTALSRDLLNPDSLKVVTAKVEASLAKAKPQDHFQLLKQGYFVVDDDSTPEHLVLNRTCSLKDNYLK